MDNEAKVDQNQNKQHLQLLNERIGHFQPQLGEAMTKLLTGDRSSEKGYQIETADNQYVPGLVHIQEKGDGWSRHTRVFTQDTNVEKTGTVKQTFEEAGGAYPLKVETSINPDGALYQSVVCTVDRASRQTWGEKPLVAGEQTFFKHASGMSFFTETVSVGPDGKKDSRLYSSDDKWLGGRNRYRTTTVTSDNGVVKYGSGEHGIMIGFVPEMRVVTEK